MNKFIDREEQKKWLEDQCQDKGLTVIYGRRRVGKTALIEEVIKDKKAIYFLADQRPENQNIAGLQAEMADFVEEDLFREAEFDDWIKLFQEFVERIDQELIIAVDEFPYLIEGNDAIPSIFQKIWDQILEDENIGLVLCGSSISMMENHVLDYKSPLYGRRTGQWKLKPLEFDSFSLFFPSLEFEERLKLYGLIDGIPAYIKHMDTENTTEQNLEENILTKGSVLYEEAEFLLKQEMRNPTNYFAILQAIAEGYTRFGEIVNRTSLNKSTVSQYLSNLQEIHVVEKEFPVTQNTESRNALYQLSDNYYSCWFDMVYPNKGMVEQNKQEKLMENIQENLRHRTSRTFEQVCRQISAKKFDIGKIGRWWHNQHEIDVVGLNEEKSKILLGECKWKNSKVGLSTFKQLKEEAEMVKWGGEDRIEKYVLFSKSGFTKKLQNESEEQENLELFDIQRLKNTN